MSESVLKGWDNPLLNHEQRLGFAVGEIKFLMAKTNNSLANNLCPDHRDKQAGKPCLACEIERLSQQLEEAKRDAERYRWIRDKMTKDDFYDLVRHKFRYGWDNFIDDSIKESND